MRECLACEKQFDEGDLEHSNRKDIPELERATYCSEYCYKSYTAFLIGQVKMSKNTGLINDEGTAIQSSENSPDVVRRIIGGLNIKLTNNNK